MKDFARSHVARIPRKLAYQKTIPILSRRQPVRRGRTAYDGIVVPNEHDKLYYPRTPYTVRRSFAIFKIRFPATRRHPLHAERVDRLMILQQYFPAHDLLYRTRSIRCHVARSNNNRYVVLFFRSHLYYVYYILTIYRFQRCLDYNGLV